MIPPHKPEKCKPARRSSCCWPPVGMSWSPMNFVHSLKASWPLPSTQVIRQFSLSHALTKASPFLKGIMTKIDCEVMVAEPAGWIAFKNFNTVLHMVGFKTTTPCQFHRPIATEIAKSYDSPHLNLECLCESHSPANSFLSPKRCSAAGPPMSQRYPQEFEY